MTAMPAMLGKARDHIAGSLQQFKEAGIVADPAEVLTVLPSAVRWRRR